MAPSLVVTTDPVRSSRHRKQTIPTEVTALDDGRILALHAHPAGRTSRALSWISGLTAAATTSGSVFQGPWPVHVFDTVEAGGRGLAEDRPTCARCGQAVGHAPPAPQPCRSPARTKPVSYAMTTS